MSATIPAAARPGRLMVLIAIAVTLIGDLIVISLTIPHAPLPKAASSVVRWLITAALCYAIWRGYPWARWLTVGLLGLGLFLAVPAAFATRHPLMIGIALQFAIAVALLAFPPGVSAFLKLQRQRYAESAR